MAATQEEKNEEEKGEEQGTTTLPSSSLAWKASFSPPVLMGWREGRGRR
jgi:hypothetical protein